MATFIVLIDYTEQGLQNVEAGPNRSFAFVEAARSAGAEVKGLYWTMGGHDGVVVLDAPDDVAASKLVLSLGRAGNVRTTTLRAFDSAEMQSMLGS